MNESPTRRSLLKAFPLALGGGLMAVPVLQAFTAEDLKEAQKGKLLKTEPTILERMEPSGCPWSPYRNIVGPAPTLGTHSCMIDDETNEVEISLICFIPWSHGTCPANQEQFVAMAHLLHPCKGKNYEFQCDHDIILI